MFTKTFTIERHIEELRAELRGTADTQEASDIRAELDAMLALAADLNREKATAPCPRWRERRLSLSPHWLRAVPGGETIVLRLPSVRSAAL